MNVPQPMKEVSDVVWFSLSGGLLGMGWLVTLVVAALLVVGVAAVCYGIFGSQHNADFHLNKRHAAREGRKGERNPATKLGKQG